MSKIGQLKLASNAGRKATCVLALALTYATTIVAAHAETRTFGCSFVTRYSHGEVIAAISFARHAVGSGEASNLYNYYASLKNECQSNPTAKRVVNLSPAVVALIAGN
jgi:hypothetical protein